MGISKYNQSGCLDLTAYEALTNVLREEMRNAQTRRPPVYICSPFAGNTAANTEKALRYCRFALDRGKLPVAPHCYFPRFLDDADPAERALGLSFGLRFLRGCRELWVFGSHVSPGMRQEIAAAKKRGIKIKNFNENMEEIPHDSH